MIEITGDDAFDGQDAGHSALLVRRHHQQAHQRWNAYAYAHTIA